MVDQGPPRPEGSAPLMGAGVPSSSPLQGGSTRRGVHPPTLLWSCHPQHSTGHRALLLASTEQGLAEAKEDRGPPATHPPPLSGHLSVPCPIWWLPHLPHNQKDTPSLGVGGTFHDPHLNKFRPLLCSLSTRISPRVTHSPLQCGEQAEGLS